jgi:hypothetical protein
MKLWQLIRFSREEVAGGLVPRLMRELLPLTLQIHDHAGVGVFIEKVDGGGRAVYFSPGATTAFAPALAKLPAEHCDPPNPETVSVLYGARECLDVQPPRILRLVKRLSKS